MKVSVVILNWNGCDMLRTFLPSVVRYSEGEGIEVCVADNGSTDASVTLLQQEFPSVRTIVRDQNYGFADGWSSFGGRLLTLFPVPTLFGAVTAKNSETQWENGNECSLSFIRDAFHHDLCMT